MADATARDEGLGNLEAFLSLLQATRSHLGELEAALDGRAAGLNDEALLLASRGEALSHNLSSLAGGIAVAQQETAAELGSLGQAALATVEERLGAVRSGLERTGVAAERRPGLDLIWFTPRVDDEDPCERFRDQLEKLRTQPERN